MTRIATSTRVALCLTLLSLNAILVASMLNLYPNERAIRMEGRVALCESLAVSCSRMVSNHDMRGVEQIMNALVLRNPEVLSAVLRNTEGRELVHVGQPMHGKVPLQHEALMVPIANRYRSWGQVEVWFRTLTVKDPWGIGLHISPFTRFALFVTAFNGLAFLLWLRKTLVRLDPSKVVPGRVRAALDTLTEGLLVLDQSGRIAFANRTFANTIGQTTTELQGRKVAELPLVSSESSAGIPWGELIASAKPRAGMSVSLGRVDGEQCVFKVNSAPILDDRGAKRGILVSFDDVTAMEKKKAELMTMLNELKKSRDKIRRQNRQLQVLATRDGLTGCFNRRSFFEAFDKAWEFAEREHQPLSCVMVDVDHFKVVNDTHGHAVGDDVLGKVAGSLRKAVNNLGIVGRYGGEEFCILLPGFDLQEASVYAESYRSAVAALKFPNFCVTASFGVSSSAAGAGSPHEMMDQADKCLYVAKRGGRNRVVRWDQVPQEVRSSAEEDPGPGEDEVPSKSTESVPYHAVSALLSALAYRDPDTAAHSTRVADLCVAAARGLMSVAEIYILETAALLHDIGKIGVPDSILLKPAGLTRDEFRIMKMHDRIGVEIVAASFHCELLVKILRYHHALYAADPAAAHLPSGKDIPLGARIVSIADAYDAMVSDRVYRKGRSREEAFAELRRWAGVQFDPELVEHFIEVVLSRRETNAPRDARFSKELALHLGLQTEHLVRAVNEHDLGSIAALATRLEATASKYGTSEVARIARELHSLSSDATDLDQVIQLAHELVDLCTYAQKAYATVEDDFADASRARRQGVETAMES